MTGRKASLFGVSDMERLINGRSSDSRSDRQKKIRHLLRELGEGVGRGNRYRWTEAELHRLARFVKAKITGQLGV